MMDVSRKLAYLCPAKSLILHGTGKCSLYVLRSAAMANGTQIEWTDATWNPVTGCSRITAGCDNCYAERFSERFRGVPDHPFQNGFDLTLRPARLTQPLSWKAPRRVFVNSMSDLFHKEVPRSFIDKAFDTRERATWHTFQVSPSAVPCSPAISIGGIRPPGPVAYLAGELRWKMARNAARIKHLNGRACVGEVRVV